MRSQPIILRLFLYCPLFFVLCIFLSVIINTSFCLHTILCYRPRGHGGPAWGAANRQNMSNCILMPRLLWFSMTFLKVHQWGPTWGQITLIPDFIPVKIKEILLAKWFFYSTLKFFIVKMMTSCFYYHSKWVEIERWKFQHGRVKWK